MDYYERGMIAYTVIRYHSHLLTSFECSVLAAFQARWKADAYRNPNVEQHLRKGWGNLEDPRIDAILDRGYDEFSWTVAERVLVEHGGRVVLNRCPECDRIAETPKARQCLWCGHDWHLK